jgi:hypothetical protein|nr:MAG TPA: hypothetical protein [Caudoviricetes sp.]
MINASREERKWKSAIFFEKYTFALKSAVFFSYISYKGLFTYKSVI